MAQPSLIAIGGAHIDRRGKISGLYLAGASNPGTMSEEPGGGALNALRAAVQRGISGAIVSLRGGDMAGKSVADAIEAAGIRDLSATFLDRVTPSYTALIDRDGDVIAGLADMALYDLAFSKQLMRSGIRAAIAASDAALADANLPTAAIKRLVALAAGKPVYAIAVSPAKVVRFEETLPALAGLFMNRREAAALSRQSADTDSVGLIRALMQKGLRAGVVTAGNAALCAFDSEGVFTLTPPFVDGIADATGAGDALAGATVAATMRGTSLRNAVREGVAAASATLVERTAVSPLPEKRFQEILATIPDCMPVE